MWKKILFLIKIILVLKTIKMDNMNSFKSNTSEIEKELIEYGFEKEFIDLALKISTKKEEALDL
jgi:hypothetical protein